MVIKHFPMKVEGGDYQEHLPHSSWSFFYFRAVFGKKLCQIKRLVSANLGIGANSPYKSWISHVTIRDILTCVSFDQSACWRREYPSPGYVMIRML